MKKGKQTPLVIPGADYLTIERAAAFCGGISEARIRLALTRGELRRFKAGSGSHARTLVAVSDLRKFIVQVA
jgi:hypothetical protein